MGMSGLDLIRAERVRQIHSEGYTREKDLGRHEQLAAAGTSYEQHSASPTPPSTWPWASEFWKPVDDEKRNLIRAGALYQAAADALDNLPLLFARHIEFIAARDRVSARLDEILAAEPVRMQPSEGFRR